MARLPTIYRFERATCTRCGRDSPYCAPVRRRRATDFRLLCATCRLAMQGESLLVPDDWNDGWSDEKNDRMTPDEWQVWREENPPLEIEE